MPSSSASTPSRYSSQIEFNREEEHGHSKLGQGDVGGEDLHSIDEETVDKDSKRGLASEDKMSVRFSRTSETEATGSGLIVGSGPDSGTIAGSGSGSGVIAGSGSVSDSHSSARLDSEVSITAKFSRPIGMTFKLNPSLAELTEKDKPSLIENDRSTLTETAIPSYSLERKEINIEQNSITTQQKECSKST